MLTAPSELKNAILPIFAIDDLKITHVTPSVVHVSCDFVHHEIETKTKIMNSMKK